LRPAKCGSVMGCTNCCTWASKWAFRCSFTGFRWRQVWIYN